MGEALLLRGSVPGRALAVRVSREPSDEFAVDGSELTGRFDLEHNHIDRGPCQLCGCEDVLGDALGSDRGAVWDERQPGPLLLEVADGAVDLVGVGSAELDLDDVAACRKGDQEPGWG